MAEGPIAVPRQTVNGDEPLGLNSLYQPLEDVCIRKWRLGSDHEHHGVGAALFLQGDARAWPGHGPPVVFSSEEVAPLLDAASPLKYKAALSVAYGADLRASELVSLKVSDSPRVKLEGRLTRAW